MTSISDKPSKREGNSSLPLGILKKRAARLAALQVFYSHDITQEDVSTLVLNHHQEEATFYADEEGSLPPADKKFLLRLVQTTAEHLEQVDELILAHLGEGWDIERIDKAMRALLRVGVAEIYCFKDTTLHIILNEYVSIAKGFFTPKEVGFINGILDKIGHKVRKESENIK